MSEATPAPEIPEGVETKDVQVVALGLAPYVLVQVVENGTQVSVAWGGGVPSKVDAAHLLSSAVTNLVHDLSHSTAPAPATGEESPS